MISSAFLAGWWKTAGIKVGSAAWCSLVALYQLSALQLHVVESKSRVLRVVCSTAQLDL